MKLFLEEIKDEEFVFTALRPMKKACTPADTFTFMNSLFCFSPFLFVVNQKKLRFKFNWAVLQSLRAYSMV